MKIISKFHNLVFKEQNKVENDLKLKNSFIIFNILAAMSLLLIVIGAFTKLDNLLISLCLLLLGLLAYIVQLYKISIKKNIYLNIILTYVFIPSFIFSARNSLINKINPKILDSTINVILIVITYLLIYTIFKIWKKSDHYKKHIIDPLQEDKVKKSGSHVVGKDTETGETVEIPLNDRYVHTLIIGATGTGKTSQVLLPMINNDLQNHELGTIVIEPKGDLAEEAYQMALKYNRNALYFNPMLKNCPYFNPLYGNEDDVIENLATAFRMLDPDSSMFFQNQAENLIRKAIKVLKRLYGNDATLIDLNTLLWNTDNEGRKILIDFHKKAKSITLQAENDELYNWFMSDYFTGTTGDRSATKTYEYTSGIRTQVSKLVSNTYLRKVLNPPKGIGTDINFVKALANSEVICVSTAQGDLQALGSYLGYFLILQLQAAVFKRPGDENTRKPCVLTIDEFQVFANPGFSNMLTQGRSYRIPCVLATQNLTLLGMNSGRQGKDFAELVKTNARNLIVFPGCSYVDADYFSKLFGEDIVENTRRSSNRTVYNPFIGWELKPSGETTTYIEEREARYSPTDIINMQFTEILCRLIVNNSVQRAQKCKISFIEKSLHDEMKEKVTKYRNENIIDTNSILDYEVTESESLVDENLENEFSKFNKKDSNKGIVEADEDDEI